MLNAVNATSPGTISNTPAPARPSGGTPQETSPAPLPKDIVEITVTQTGQTAPLPKSRTYGPRTVAEKFRYDIEHGMFNERLRYDPLSVRFEEVASSTYEARKSVSGQVFQFSGNDSSVAALFALNYQDSQPNPTQATSHVDARIQENRRIDRGLDLLNML